MGKTCPQGPPTAVRAIRAIRWGGGRIPRDLLNCRTAKILKPGILQVVQKILHVLYGSNAVLISDIYDVPGSSSVPLKGGVANDLDRDDRAGESLSRRLNHHPN